MALLVPRALVVGILCLVGPGCSLIDPLLVSDRYNIQAEGQHKIVVKFEGGTKNVSMVRQQDVIHDLMIDLSRDPKQHSFAFDAMLELEDLLQHSGYPLAEVGHRVDHDDKGGTMVVFQIRQGPRVTVENLLIEGNKSIPSEDLVAYWSRTQTEVLGFGDDLYVPDDIDSLVKAIHGHYRRLGYLDVEVDLLPLDPPLRPDSRKVTVRIRVTEKTRYSLDSLTIEDNIAKRMLRHPQPPPNPGDPFVGQDFRNYALALAQHLRRHGHHKPEILTTFQIDKSTGTVKVRIHGDPGPTVRVTRIDIAGLGFVSEGQVRKRIELTPGKIFDGKREDDTILRLYRSGFFKRVEVNHLPDGDGQIIVAFHVQETERYLVQPLIGWGSYEEARAGLEFEMLSLLGTGFDLSAKVTVSDKGYRAVTTISDTEFWPDLLGFDNTFSISADAFKRREPSYTDGAVGISPALAHLFSRELSGRVAYIFREHRDAESSVEDPGAKIGRYTEGSALAEMTWDSRDNPLIPRRGSRVSLQYMFYDDALGGDVKFDRLRVTGSHIFPFTENTRFVLHAEAAWLTPKNGSDAIPIQERYFNGGENTVRSYREDQLADADLKDVNGQVVGGEFHNIFNLEYRWAVSSLKGIGLELSLFADAGNVGKFSDDYGTTDMKYGVGAGVRLLLPIGPVRFDVGHNPDRDAGERAWTFHFSIGYPF